MIFSSWLVPGGGHFVLGRRTQAAVFFLTISLTFFAGMYLADFTNVSPEHHGYYYVAQIWNGAQTLIATWVTRGIVADHVPRHLGTATAEIGNLYTAVAALLNVIVMMDAYGVVMRIREGEAEVEEPEEVLEP